MYIYICWNQVSTPPPSSHLHMSPSSPSDHSTLRPTATDFAKLRQAPRRFVTTRTAWVASQEMGRSSAKNRADVNCSYCNWLEWVTFGFYTHITAVFSNRNPVFSPLGVAIDIRVPSVYESWYNLKFISWWISDACQKKSNV
jgi:hypothetical protein